jgi:hypothetical protein
MLVDIEIPSIYNHAPLPQRMAQCTPDTRAAILALAGDMNQLGHTLRLSDLFRGYEMQKKSHEDWLLGRKQAYSPPPGGSMHEAGRAMDVDLVATGMPLADFWKHAARHGFHPIISSPNSGQSEAWHFDCRGSHGLVYEYVRTGKAGPNLSPYKQMAASAILTAGISVDYVKNQQTAQLQSALIRLGADPGPIDGVAGERTQSALGAFGRTTAAATAAVEERLRCKWAAEY